LANKAAARETARLIHYKEELNISNSLSRVTVCDEVRAKWQAVDDIVKARELVAQEAYFRACSELQRVDLQAEFERAKLE